MKLTIILMAVIVLWSSIAIITCNNNADDDSDDPSDDDNDTYPSSDDTDDNPECDSNHAPELLGLAIRINGEPVDMPATVYTTDKLELVFEYNDTDCNLDGGNIEFETSEGISTDPSFNLDGIGCSSSEDGEPYVKEIDPGLQLFTYSIYFYLSDVCEGESNQLPLDIEVVYNE